MKEKRAILFISHHPGDLLLYKNISILMRRLLPKASIILFKINHRYYHSFNMSPYVQSFDSIEEFPFITYQKNLLKGSREMRHFRKRLSEIKSLLHQYHHIDVYMQDSAWLPVNMMLFFLNDMPSIKHILRWNFGMEEHKQVREDSVRTWYCRFYHALFGGAFPVRAVSTLEGKFVDFLYTERVPGEKLTIISPAREKKTLRENEIYFPLFKGKQSPAKDMVIIFGDADILDFNEYVDDYEKAEKKLAVFFEYLQKMYHDCVIYYKSHPGDGASLMPGIKKESYRAFKEGLNTQSILDMYHSRIKAVYTVFSTSAMWSSFFGIPSYVAYRLIYNKAGVKRFDHVFMQESMTSSLLTLISRKEDIGKNDQNLASLHYTDLEHIDEASKHILTR